MMGRDIRVGTGRSSQDRDGEGTGRDRKGRHLDGTVQHNQPPWGPCRAWLPSSLDRAQPKRANELFEVSHFHLQGWWGMRRSDPGAERIGLGSLWENGTVTVFWGIVENGGLL